MHDPVYGSNPKAGIPRPGAAVSVPAAAEKDETKQAEAVENVTDSLLGDVIAEVAKEALKGAKEELASAPAAALEPGHPAPAPADAPPQKKSRTESEESPDSFCPECTQPLPDPTSEELSLFLHALSYEGEGWKYSTEKPYWTADDFAL